MDLFESKTKTFKDTSQYVREEFKVTKKTVNGFIKEVPMIWSSKTWAEKAPKALTDLQTNSSFANAKADKAYDSFSEKEKRARYNWW